MSYANGTTHYNLPQTVGTDKRDWADTNQAFSDVDAALYTAATTASTVASDLSTLDNQVNGVGGIDARLTTAENDIDNVEGDVSTLQSTVGSHTTQIADVRQDCEDMITAHNEAAAESATHYDIGDEFIYNDVLYRATAEINIGDTIVPNTNCAATNVMTEVNAINTALTDLDGYTFDNYLGYRKIGRLVEVYTTADSLASDTVLGTLPVGYRPDHTITLINNLYEGHGIIIIDTNGVVTFYNNTSANMNCRLHHMFFS